MGTDRHSKQTTLFEVTVVFLGGVSPIEVIANWPLPVRRRHPPVAQESDFRQLERIPVMWKRSLHVGSNWRIPAG
jgi:hypothetical protein